MAYLRTVNGLKTNEAGTGSIAVSLAVPNNNTYRLHSASCKFDAAPTTSENFTITLDANAGPAYDILLYTVDPAAAAATSLLWQPDQPLLLEAGDQIDIAYTNTDGRTYGVQITSEVV